MHQKQILSWVAAAAMTISLLPNAALATDFTGEGSGTAEDPYIIKTAEDLNSMREDPSASYKLESDIDLSQSEYADNWVPIGTATYEELGAMNTPNAFSGNLDGTKSIDENGNVTETYKISNINIDVSADENLITAGLFSVTSGDGKISNLTLENVSVKGGENSMAVGGLVGYGMSSGGIENVTLSGEANTITGTNCVGGIVGGDGTNVINCVVLNTTVNIFGDNTIGDDSFASGRLVQHDVAECGGAVVGGGFGASVTGCYAENCTINANTESGAKEAVGLGGIGGCLQCMTEIKNNHAKNITINAEGAHAIGGLCGYAGNGNMPDYYGTDCSISNCTVTDLTINAPNATHVGGLIGTNMYYNGMEGQFDILSDCSVSGTITAGTDSISIYGESTPGAVVGRAAGCTISDDACDYSNLTINGVTAEHAVGITNCMFESADQDESLEQSEAGVQLNSLFNTYQPLFQDATFDEKCDNYWHDAAAAVVGESMADTAVTMMKASVGAEIYGQAAIEAYTENPDSTAFCCNFINSVVKFNFNGTEISGIDADGNTVFSHAYKCIGKKYIGEETGLEDFGGYTFESLDEDSGEFTYFIMLPDTPQSTYHIEFRYGSNLEALQKYAEGDYAYWVAAGIPVSAMDEASDDKGQNDTSLRNVIGLFVAENLSEMTSDETVSQRTDLVGTWDASEETLQILREQTGLPNINMYCKLNSNGLGETYLDLEGNGNFIKSSSYTFYAYDNDNSDAKSGMYISVPEDSSQTTIYEITTTDNKTNLAFFAADGVSRWVKQDEPVTPQKTSGGGGGSSSCRITYNSNGGSSIITSSIRYGNTATKPDDPTKEGFVFNGWYTDSDLKTPYDFTAKVTKSFTLYAKWTKDASETNDNKNIILTIGKKEASVWGKTNTNDVAPIIVSDRTMLPARFVAESLGATVTWNQEEQKVTISNDTVTIIIIIGSDTAYVNDKPVSLDSPAFIENERTYTPLRFISENLGATVTWDDATQQITITKIA